MKILRMTILYDDDVEYEFTNLPEKLEALLIEFRHLYEDDDDDELLSIHHRISGD